MASIDVAVIVTPKPGKAEQFLEMFQKCVEYVQANEPYVLRYEVHQSIKKDQFIILETYENKEGMDKHVKAAPVQALMAAFAAGDFADSQIVVTTPGPGITARL